MVELLVATAIFTFVATGTSALFVSALDIQRRAVGIQKIEENAQFALESIAREVRVSTITSGDTDCSPPDPGTTRQMTINHPTNGAVTYEYDPNTVFPGGAPIGSLLRNGEPITSSDVNFTKFAFCVIGSGADDVQARVTMPMTIESISGRPANRSEVSLQTTIVSRDLSADLTN